MGSPHGLWVIRNGNIYGAIKWKKIVQNWKFPIEDINKWID